MPAHEFTGIEFSNDTGGNLNAVVTDAGVTFEVQGAPAATLDEGDVEALVKFLRRAIRQDEEEGTRAPSWRARAREDRDTTLSR